MLDATQLAYSLSWFGSSTTDDSPPVPEELIRAVPLEETPNFPECDYDKNPTNLFKAIEAKKWDAVEHFLLTGSWRGVYEPNKQHTSTQVCTWVTKYERSIDGHHECAKWTQLPIHAALTFGAPHRVISLLTKICPGSTRCADDQRRLPLHLAFKYGASDDSIGILLDAFPEAIGVPDFEVRTPVECALSGPNSKRSEIIQSIVNRKVGVCEKKEAKLKAKQAKQEKKITHLSESLKNKCEKVEDLKIAVDLIKWREDKAKKDILTLLAEVKGINQWYKEHEKVATREAIVEDLSTRLASLQQVAEDLITESERQLNESPSRERQALFGSLSNLSKGGTWVTEDGDNESASVQTEISRISTYSQQIHMNKHIHAPQIGSAISLRKAGSGLSFQRTKSDLAPVAEVSSRHCQPPSLTREQSTGATTGQSATTKRSGPLVSTKNEMPSLGTHEEESVTRSDEKRKTKMSAWALPFARNRSKMSVQEHEMALLTKKQSNDSAQDQSTLSKSSRPKDFKGRVAFFEKMTQPEQPSFDPSRRVKTEVSERVRSAQDQVQTIMGRGNMPLRNRKTKSPSDLTPFVERRDASEEVQPTQLEDELTRDAEPAMMTQAPSSEKDQLMSQLKQRCQEVIISEQPIPPEQASPVATNKMPGVGDILKDLEGVFSFSTKYTMLAVPVQPPSAENDQPKMQESHEKVSEQPSITVDQTPQVATNKTTGVAEILKDLEGVFFFRGMESLMGKRTPAPIYQNDVENHILEEPEASSQAGTESKKVLKAAKSTESEAFEMALVLSEDDCSQKSEVEKSPSKAENADEEGNSNICDLMTESTIPSGEQQEWASAEEQVDQDCDGIQKVDNDSDEIARVLKLVNACEELLKMTETEVQETESFADSHHDKAPITFANDGDVTCERQEGVEQILGDTFATLTPVASLVPVASDLEAPQPTIRVRSKSKRASFMKSLTKAMKHEERKLPESQQIKLTPPPAMEHEVLPISATGADVPVEKQAIEMPFEAALSSLANTSMVPVASEKELAPASDGMKSKRTSFLKSLKRVSRSLPTKVARTRSAANATGNLFKCPSTRLQDEESLIATFDTFMLEDEQAVSRTEVVSPHNDESATAQDESSFDKNIAGPDASQAAISDSHGLVDEDVEANVSSCVTSPPSTEASKGCGMETLEHMSCGMSFISAPSANVPEGVEPESESCGSSLLPANSDNQKKPSEEANESEQATQLKSKQEEEAETFGRAFAENESPTAAILANPEARAEEEKPCDAPAEGAEINEPIKGTDMGIVMNPSIDNKDLDDDQSKASSSNESSNDKVQLLEDADAADVEIYMHPGLAQAAQSTTERVHELLPTTPSDPMLPKDSENPFDEGFSQVIDGNENVEIISRVNTSNTTLPSSNLQSEDLQSRISPKNLADSDASRSSSKDASSVHRSHDSDDSGRHKLVVMSENENVLDRNEVVSSGEEESVASPAEAKKEYMQTTSNFETSLWVGFDGEVEMGFEYTEEPSEDIEQALSTEDVDTGFQFPGEQSEGIEKASSTAESLREEEGQDHVEENENEKPEVKEESENNEEEEMKEEQEEQEENEHMVLQEEIEKKSDQDVEIEQKAEQDVLVENEQKAEQDVEIEQMQPHEESEKETDDKQEIAPMMGAVETKNRLRGSLIGRFRKSTNKKTSADSLKKADDSAVKNAQKSAPKGVLKSFWKKGGRKKVMPAMA